MRKLKLQIQVSLDGFADGPNGESDWVFVAGPDPEGFQKLVDLAQSSDTLLMGRKLAQSGFIDHWQGVADSPDGNPQKIMGQLISGFRKVVFGSTQISLNNKSVEIENGDLAEAVQALKKQPGKDILVYGGIDFVSSLIKLDLIDEYYIITCPVAIGDGVSMFKERKVLKLESSTPFKNGKVMNKYVPV